MKFVAMPPATVNPPPAYSAGPLPSSNTVSAETALTYELEPSNPRPSADQLDPSHRAMRLAATPPAVVNSPPAYSARPLPSSNIVRAVTPLPYTPPPTSDQLAP